jgi:hypothetical protein
LANSTGGTAILLTDGVVDISKDPAINLSEKKRILEEVIPKLIKANAQVYTVALSDNADTELLQEIAHRTGGLFEVALSPEALTRIFLRMFDEAVKQDQLPLVGGSFDVDSSIEEFTLLVFVAPGSIPMQLRSPDNTFYLADSHPAFITWYRDNGYELITVTRPIEGTWKLFSDEDPQNRVTILSDLKLEVTNLQNTIYAGKKPLIEAYLLQDDEIISDEQFLELMDVQLVVKTPDGELLAKRLADSSKGVYSTLLDLFGASGRYLVKVSVDARTFKREFIQEVVFEAGVELVYLKGQNKIQVALNATISNSPKLKVIATLTDDKEKRRFVPLSINDEGNWQAALKNIDNGKYDVAVNIKCETEAGRRVVLNSNHLEIEVGIVDKEVSDVEGLSLEESPWWEKYLAYILIGFGNILVFGLGLWVYLRRKRDSLIDDELIGEIDGDAKSAAGSIEEAEGSLLEELETPGKGSQEDTKLANDGSAGLSENESYESNQGEGLSDIVDAWGADLNKEPSADLNKEPSADLNKEPSADLNKEPSDEVREKGQSDSLPVGDLGVDSVNNEDTKEQQ